MRSLAIAFLLPLILLLAACGDDASVDPEAVETVTETATVTVTPDPVEAARAEFDEWIDAIGETEFAGFCERYAQEESDSFEEIWETDLGSEVAYQLLDDACTERGLI